METCDDAFQTSSPTVPVSLHKSIEGDHGDSSSDASANDSTPGLDSLELRRVVPVRYQVRFHQLQHS